MQLILRLVCVRSQVQIMPSRIESSAPKKPTGVPAQGSGGIPDLEYIKARIPIADIARELGLEVTG